MIQFILNNETIQTAVPPGTLLVDFIRYQAHLTGTKIGCREGDCGACTVLAGSIKDSTLQYTSLTSCLTPLGNIHHKHIVTVEGLNQTEGLNPIQQAMTDESATQCGFCTPGFVVSMAGFCLSQKEPSYEQALAAVDGNICRCTGYKSIERALQTVTVLMQQKTDVIPMINFLTDKKVLPAYFREIEKKLKDWGQQTNRSMVQTPAAIFLGGGTDLYVQQHEKMAHSAIHFLFNNNQLKGITREKNTCVIGASTTVTELMESTIFRKALPGFTAFAKLVSSTPIRNIATLAGNFSNASPIGDLSVLFLALDASVQLRTGESTRELPLRQFFKAYKQIDKKQEEYIEKIMFEMPAGKCMINFEKVSKRRNLDIASVNTAIKITMEDDIVTAASVAAGGVAPVPAFLKNASLQLTGQRISEDLVTTVVEAARREITPISDARGTADYKKQLLGQLIKAHFIELFPALDVQQLMAKA